MTRTVPSGLDHPPTVGPGFELPSLVVRPSHLQLFMFSASTWNRHHIHYSKDAALAEGLPDIVVHRALLGNYLAQMLGNWAGDAAAVRRLSWRVLQSAPVGMLLTCRGRVTEAQAVGLNQEVACELEIKGDNGQTIATGSAVVLLPLPS
jgi:hydroxyacyl-ACP dehydratase HTD2-like protein with hotdog domain